MLLPYDLNKKYFFITRGIPGSGKSTFVKEVLSKISVIVEADVIREELMGLIFNSDKNDYGINQSNGKEVWNVIYERVKRELKNNSVTLDATNIHKWSLNIAIKIGEELNAEVIIIDFSNVTLEECIQRNSLRQPTYKRVPQYVIERMYKEIQKANKKLSDFTNIYPVTVIKDWLSN